MESRYILKKDHLPALLRRLQKSFRVVAPLRNRYGDTLYSELGPVEEADLDLQGQAQAPAKNFFLPQQEVLFTYRTDRTDGYGFSPVLPSCPPTIYFGLRSCDLAAILYTDVAFLQKQKDPHYWQRRQEAILINIGCNEPQPSCFCQATRSGPFLEFGYDLQLTDLGDRFFVEVGRTRGAELVRSWAIFFAPATEEDIKAQYQTALEAQGKFRHVEIEQAIKRLAEEGGDEEVWAELAARCQGCNGCAYLCPTCTCFSLHDQPLSAEHGERLRVWDSCTMPGFTQMAGGHNPVDPGRHLLRRRFQHKLRDSVRQHGRPSCVGCGRCVDICFGGIDMLGVIERLAGEETK